MSAKLSWLLLSFKRVLAQAVIAGGLVGLTSASLAQDLPTFRAGMWEFSRTVKSSTGKTQNLTTRKCTSPTDDMKKQNDMLTKAGCKFSPVTKRGKFYTFTSQCTIQGMSGQSKSVMSVDGDAAYRVDVESQQGGQSTKELLVARRVGDC